MFSHLLRTWWQVNNISEILVNIVEHFAASEPETPYRSLLRWKKAKKASDCWTNSLQLVDTQRQLKGKTSTFAVCAKKKDTLVSLFGHNILAHVKLPRWASPYFFLVIWRYWSLTQSRKEFFFPEKKIHKLWHPGKEQQCIDSEGH